MGMYEQTNINIWAFMLKIFLKKKKKRLLCLKMLMFKNACLFESNDMNICIKIGFK